MSVPRLPNDPRDHPLLRRTEPPHESEGGPPCGGRGLQHPGLAARLPAGPGPLPRPQLRGRPQLWIHAGEVRRVHCFEGIMPPPSKHLLCAGSPTALASPPATLTTGWAGARATSTASPPTLDITVQYLHTTRNTLPQDILTFSVSTIQHGMFAKTILYTTSGSDSRIYPPPHICRGHHLHPDPGPREVEEQVGQHGRHERGQGAGEL